MLTWPKSSIPSRTRTRNPSLNAYAEPSVRSIKEECLSKNIPIVERRLLRMLDEFAKQHHVDRNHHGLSNRVIEGTRSDEPARRVECRERLGGLLRFDRVAA